MPTTLMIAHSYPLLTVAGSIHLMESQVMSRDASNSRERRRPLHHAARRPPVVVRCRQPREMRRAERAAKAAHPSRPVLLPHAFERHGQEWCHGRRHHVLPRLAGPVDANRRRVVLHCACAYGRADVPRPQRSALSDVLGKHFEGLGVVHVAALRRRVDEGLAAGEVQEVRPPVQRRR
eukprot:5467436-Pleurochrysis_carterae.AAC.3